MASPPSKLCKNLYGLEAFVFHEGWSTQVKKGWRGSTHASSIPLTLVYCFKPVATTNWSYWIFLPFLRTTEFSVGKNWVTPWPSELAANLLSEFLGVPCISNLVNLNNEYHLQSFLVERSYDWILIKHSIISNKNTCFRSQYCIQMVAQQSAEMATNNYNVVFG